MQNGIVREVIVKDYRKRRLVFLGLRLLGCAAALTLPVGSVSAKVGAPQTIWAKAEVGEEQFRADALECGMQGLAKNIDTTEEVKTLARASKQLEAIDATTKAAWSQQAGQMGQHALDIATSRAMQEQAVLATARPEEQYARIKEMMFKVVRSCMIHSGYAMIVLTEDQRNEYNEMKGGVEARRAYIHKLASDPHVLETQREAVAQ